MGRREIHVSNWWESQMKILGRPKRWLMDDMEIDLGETGLRWFGLE
jgi:hypothetical protein